MATLNELRALALKRTRAASQKVARNRGKGVQIAGTGLDPRAARDDISKMNRRQVNSYMKRVNSFTDRKTQFKAGVRGAPLPAAKVDEYQRLEVARNIRYRKHRDSMGDIFIEPSGMTVRQREVNILGRNQDILNSGGRPDYSPYNDHTRAVAGIVDADALDTLIKYERRSLRPMAIEHALKAQKNLHIEFLEENGETGLAEAIRGLSLTQFDVLKNNTEYLRSVNHLYQDEDNGSDEEVIETQRVEAAQLVNWAKTIRR